VRFLAFTVLCGQNSSDGVETRKMIRVMANGMKEEDRKK
jgi:hypothetical protein